MKENEIWKWNAKIHRLSMKKEIKLTRNWEGHFCHITGHVRFVQSQSPKNDERFNQTKKCVYLGNLI